MRLGLQSAVPGYITHAPTPYLNGLGDANTDQQISGVATALATTTVGILTALHSTVLGLAFTGPVGAAIGAAIAGLGALATVLIKEFSGCGQSCIIAANDANKYEPYLQQNLTQYLSSPIHYASLQAAALNNFDTIWTALRTACSDPSLGPAGQRCISDRQSGACQWKSSAYGWSQDSTGNWKFTPSGPAGSGDQCWNWVDYYRASIANDPTVVPDPTPGSTVGSTVTGVNGQPIQVGSSGFDIPAPLLIGGAALLMLALVK